MSIQIWSESYLNQLAKDAEQDINKRVQCIFERFYLPVTLGLQVYTLPSYVRGIQRIQWRGKSLDPLNWEEGQAMTPATVFVGPGNPGNVDSVISRPLYYWMHPTNPYDIRLFPTPDESFDLTPSTDDPYSPLPNEPHCVVSCWRSIDLTSPITSIPAYADRRIRKAFIAWKAFEAEGKGQMQTASTYYQKKYEWLIQKFNLINDSCFISKKYSIEDGMLEIDGFRYPRPVLPSNFERIIY